MKALYAGSFDPIHNGHLWVIKKARNLFGEDGLTVGLAYNAAKTQMFYDNERWEMIRNLLPDIKIVSVPSHVMTAQWAREQGYTHLVRAIRNADDAAFEADLADINRQASRSIETVCWLPPPELRITSSSLLRGLAALEDAHRVMRYHAPEPIVRALLARQRGLTVAQVIDAMEGDDET